MSDRLTKRNQYGDAVLCDRLQGIGICLNEDVERVARYEDERELQQWVSVEDRLPEPFVSVLVQMPGEEPFPTVREGFISNDGIWQSAMFRREPGEVTHWQPMPEPPKGE